MWELQICSYMSAICITAQMVLKLATDKLKHSKQANVGSSCSVCPCIVSCHAAQAYAAGIHVASAGMME